MKAKKIWANFSVKDAARTKQFYTALGFAPTDFNNYPKLASFVFGENGLIIHFFEEGSQIDKYLSAKPGNSEIIFTLSADTEDEVKQWSEKVQAAGGSIFQQVGRDEDGYFGVGFSDPDGHRFNVLLMDNMGGGV